MSIGSGGVRRLIHWISGGKPSPPSESRSEPTPDGPVEAAFQRRFLSHHPRRTEEFVEAARQYMGKMSGFELEWLYRKPYDSRSGNEQFFLQVYPVMNLIRAMSVSPGGRFLEIGSGPGWVTELLMLLGYEVEGVEPCEALVAVARERIGNACRHYHVAEPPRIEFHLATLEDCELEDEAFDAVLFHDALHHVIDEERAVGRCFRCLKPGGVLGVSEDAWRPGDRMQESALEEEIARFGTFESPYTQEYLNRLLARHGFVDVERYHSINGFFPAGMGGRSVGQAAQSPASLSNNLTARKPSFHGPRTVDPDASTRAEIEILEKNFERVDRKARLKIRLTNIGETEWLHRQGKAGWVTLALRSDPLGVSDAREALPRHPLPRSVLPGEVLILELDFFLPEDFGRYLWHFDLVNEGLFWFSERGTRPQEVKFP